MKIFCKNTDSYIEIKGGESLTQVLRRLPQLDFMPICARVNNRTEPLSFQLFMPKLVEFLPPTHPSSRRVYTRSLCMMLYAAVHRLYPGASLQIEHSMCRGYYCRLQSSENPATTITPDIDALMAEMRRLHAANIPFVRHERLTKDVIEIFRAQHLDSKILLLETTHRLYTVYYTLGDLADSYYGPLAPSTGSLPVFALHPYHEGMLLMPPDEVGTAPAEVRPQPKMYNAFTEHLRFNEIVGVHNVGTLNKAIEKGHSSTLINLAETLHANSLAHIAADIARRGARIVLLAGPSSSGKTTTCKRLSIHLMTNLLRPKMISLDDYFVNREDTPRDETGDYDYEHLHAIDLPLLTRHVRALLRGEEVNLPTYSFELGRRVPKERPFRLEKGEVLLMEGIHGLNPELIQGVDPGEIYKVYISCLTTLSIDDHNWIPTTDSRLLRRLVRDHKYRHTPAVDTLRRWASVRRGEEKWIFPFQENADAMFNSSLLFEPSALKAYAEPLLQTVPHDATEYSEAARLLQFLSYFQPLPERAIPSTSLLREFLGGSTFHY